MHIHKFDPKNKYLFSPDFLGALLNDQISKNPVSTIRRTFRSEGDERTELKIHYAKTDADALHFDCTIDSIHGDDEVVEIVDIDDTFESVDQLVSDVFLQLKESLSAPLLGFATDHFTHFGTIPLEFEFNGLVLDYDFCLAIAGPKLIDGPA